MDTSRHCTRAAQTWTMPQTWIMPGWTRSRSKPGWAKRSLLFLFFVLIASTSGCQAPNTFTSAPTTVRTPAPTTAAETAPTAQWTPDALLAQAQASTGLQRIEWELRAARGFTQNHDYLTAESLLETIDYDRLNDPLKGLYVITQAELMLANRHAPEVVDILTTNRWGLLTYIDTLSAAQQLEIQLLRARAHEAAGQHIAAIRERVFLGSSLSEPSAIQDNNEAIWKNLNRLPNTAINALQNSVPDTQLQGWIELLSAYRRAHGRIHHQMSAVANWRAKWPGHPEG
ncbi:MAG: penicillin-binding protein activator [Gammaproteobacteria bacterium]